MFTTRKPRTSEWALTGRLISEGYLTWVTLSEKKFSILGKTDISPEAADLSHFYTVIIFET